MADDLDLTAGGPDGGWLRAQLDPIVSVPTAPALDAIWARRDAGPDEAPTSRRRRPPAAGLVALAAAAAILVAFLVVRDRDDPPPKRIASTLPDPTGWYVPQGLPAGWTLDTVEANASSTPTCESEGAAWTDVDATRTVGLTRWACGELPANPLFPSSSGVPEPIDGGPRVVDVDLGGGITGVAYALGDDLVASTPSPFAPVDRMIVWPADGGGTWTLRSIGVDEEPFLDAARALASDPSAGAPEVGTAIGAEVEEVDRWDTPGGDRTTEVQLAISSPTGQDVNLILASPGGGTHPEGSSIAIAEEVPGQPNPVWRFDDPSWAVRFGGAWPGADLSIVRIAQNPADWIDDDQLRTLLASLRPASAAEWRAYLDTATGPVDEAARTAPTLREVAP